MKFPTILLSLIAVISAMTSPLMAQSPDWDAIEIKTTDLGDGVYMLEGRGGNIGVSVGDDGVFIIDDQFAPLAPKIVAAISAITDKHVDYVINTHWHGDHTGGNEYFGGKGAVVVAHDNVRVRMAAEGERQSPYGALPVITFSETTTFHYNGHEIHAFHPENAHTDGDAIIHFRDIDLIHAGDVLFNGFYPYIDTSSGGSVEGYIAALESLSSMVGPDTRVISGHGPVASKADIEAKIAMLKSASASISALIAEGKSLEEAKAADPLAAYNDSWGAGFINGERMTEMLYNALK
jgi:glyoxylase-like metal-dependent hydrolase (beta-lactamase superfamily II)